MRATIRWGAWYEDTDLELAFPDGWAVRECPPADGPDLSVAEVAAAVAAPIGTPPLADLVRGRARVCIVIDDLSRPTRGDLLVPPLLEALGDADVLVLGGVANHRPMAEPDLLKKLGPDVLARSRFRNHDPLDGCRRVGTTSRGTPVEVNADFLDADLRMLVGSIIPHAGAGFSGGAKLLLPGIASLDAAHAYHVGPAMAGRYGVVESEARLDSEEAAAMVGVDFTVNMVPTARMGVGAVVSGDVVAAHRAGVDHALRLFATESPNGVDVGVFSLYPKDTEFLQHITALAPYKSASAPVVREGGTVVIAAAGTEGLGAHGLYGPGMRLEARGATRVRDRDLVFFCPNIDPGVLDPAYVVCHTWEDTVEWLVAKHGTAASVAVFPCGTIQLSA